MSRVDPAVKRETTYIAAVTLLLSALMQIVFAVIGQWNLAVLFGNLLGGVTAVGNFFLMGLTVQKAVAEEEKKAARRVRASQSYRLILQGVALVLAAVLDCFNLWAAALPLLFPRVGVQLRPLFNKQTDGGDTP